MKKPTTSDAWKNTEYTKQRNEARKYDVKASTRKYEAMEER
jgi:hypothetical protein